MPAKIDPKLLFYLACALSLLLGLAVYLPGLPGDLVFDDYSNIFGNPTVTTPHHGLIAVLQAMVSAPVGGLLRPLSMLSFIANAEWLGLSPSGFKLVNIMIHLGCGMLLWFLAREILRAYASRSSMALDERSIGWLSLAATTLWLVHPLNLTAVLYIVQRETSLSALFSAAAMLAYMVGRRLELQGAGSRLLIWGMTPLFILIGMLCKENAALTPIYLLVIEFTLLGFAGNGGRPSRQTRWFFIIFLLLPLLAVTGVAVFRPGFFFASYSARDFDAYERMLSESRIVLDYLHWLFIPDLRQLALFHDDIAPSRGLLQPASTLPSVLAIGALLWAAFALRKRSPLLSFGLLWFFAGQIMESTVLPLELAFEHRNYLPGFGLLLAATAWAYTLARDRHYAAMAKTVMVVCIAVFSVATAMRALDWRSELSFARSESAHHPLSPRAVTELEWAYLSYVVSSKDAALVPYAVDAAARAKALDPEGINQDIGLAYMFASLPDLPNTRLYLQSAAQSALTARPSSTLQLALQSLLDLAKPENKPLFPDIAAVFVNASASPRISATPCFVSDIWNTYAVFQEKIAEIPAAVGAMHKAVSLCPGKAQLRVNFANMLLHYGDPKDARVQIDALDAQHDFRYLSESRRLHAEYEQLTVASPGN